MTEQQNNEGRNRTCSVDDFSQFCEGDTEPTLNKKIHTLVEATKDYIVYLDEDLYVSMSWSDSFYEDSVDRFAEVSNRMLELETHLNRSTFPATLILLSLATRRKHG